MSHSIVPNPFALKPLVAAVALATAAGWTHATPTPNQMPGAGIVAATSLGSATALGTTYVNLTNGSTIVVDGKVVIRWGGPGAPAGETSNPYGFNLGVNAALAFTGTSSQSSVLNIDASGNASQIFGLLQATSKGGWTPSVFVANANGIIVGPSARIVAPEGVGLIGADLDNATSLNDFTANNGWVMPAAQTLGESFLTFPTIPANGNIVIGGKINGDISANVPARFVLVAGNNINVLNTGNVFGQIVELDAGVVATATSAAVGGLSNQTVNRLWSVDAGDERACCTVGPNPGELTLVKGITGNVVNEGSISAALGGGGGGGGDRIVTAANGIGLGPRLLIQASGNVRSGIMGSMDDQVGLFSDFGITIDSYSNASMVELYNVVSGYTTNTSLPFLYVNRGAIGSAMPYRADVTIDAITPGSQPSSIATTGEVRIFGGDVSILSTINHRSNADGGIQGKASLVIDGTSVDVAADVGAGDDVRIVGEGPLTISAHVLSDTNANGVGGILVANDSAPTLISGELRVPGSSSGSIYVTVNGPLTISGGVVNVNNEVDIHNNGTGAGNHTTISGSVEAGSWVHVLNTVSPMAKPLSISGSITADDDINLENLGNAAGNTTTIDGNVTSTMGNINVRHFGQATGKLLVSGSLSAFYDVNLYSDGNAQLGGMGIMAGDNINAEVLGTSLLIDGPWTAGAHIGVQALLAMTKLTPTGVLTAPAIDLMGLSFTGVNAAGNPYANTGEKPAAQIATHDLNVVLTGSMNAPVAGNTNWLLNSMDIMPLAAMAPVMVAPGAVSPAALPPVLVSVTANGGGFQAVNLRVLGDAIVDSGATTTPFIGVTLTTGGLPAGVPQGNLGSQLILQADGYLQVVGPSVTPPLPPRPSASEIVTLAPFQWPGGAVFKAGTTLQTFVPIYNAYTTASPPYGGLFFEAPYIALGGYLATSGTAWANFSTPPVAGDPTVYQIRQITPTSFGFEATTAFVKNAYSNSVTGGFVCSQTGPTTWTVCP